VLEYANEQRLCRSRMLLHYFGEEDAKDCGCCDVCLARNESGLANAEFNAIRDALLEILSTDPTPVARLTDFLPFPPERTLAVVRFLSEHDPRFTLRDGYFSRKD
jgi:ATP-dependent DNA helicase RecQ